MLLFVVFVKEDGGGGDKEEAQTMIPEKWTDTVREEEGDGGWA